MILARANNHGDKDDFCIDVAYWHYYYNKQYQGFSTWGAPLPALSVAVAGGCDTILGEASTFLQEHYPYLTS